MAESAPAAEIAPAFAVKMSRVIKGLLALHGISATELMLGVGMNKATYGRRHRRGDWTAAELERIAGFLGEPVSVFFEGPDALLRRGLTGSDVAGSTRRSPRNNPRQDPFLAA